MSSSSTGEVQNAASQRCDGVKVALLDIEGTVCPISFVKDVLYPYALTSLRTQLPSLRADPVFREHLSAFPVEYATASDDALLAHVTHLTTADIKAPYWKALQGHLWRAGYASGALRCPMFADVAPAMHRWVMGGEEEGKEGGRVQVAIFSSGSVAAQKLCFGHVATLTPDDEIGGASGSTDETHVQAGTAEDLNPLIAAYFDTTTAGPKKEPTSYVTIFDALRRQQEKQREKQQERIHQSEPAQQDRTSPPPPPSLSSPALSQIADILFLSDNIDEVRAARSTGMRSCLVVRPGNEPVDDALLLRGGERVVQVSSFEGVLG